MNSECVPNLARLKKPNTNLYSNVKTDERIELLKEIRKDNRKNERLRLVTGKEREGGGGRG